MSLNILGSSIGFDTEGFLSKALPAVLTPAAAAVDKSLDDKAKAKDKAKSEADITKSVAGVINADTEATKANAEALFTAYYAKNGDQANVTKYNAAQMVADQANRAQDTAAMGISDDVKKKRIEAADKVAKDAAVAALAAAGEVLKAKDDTTSAMASQKASAFAKAASNTAVKARGAQPPVGWSPKDPVVTPPGEKMPVWKIVAIAGGAAVFALLSVLVIKKVA